MGSYRTQASHKTEYHRRIVCLLIACCECVHWMTCHVPAGGERDGQREENPSSSVCNRNLPIACRRLRWAHRYTTLHPSLLSVSVLKIKNIKNGNDKFGWSVWNHVFKFKPARCLNFRSHLYIFKDMVWKKQADILVWKHAFNANMQKHSSYYFWTPAGSNGPQKFCIDKVGKETWLPRSHTW